MSSGYDRVKQDVFAILSRIPAGRVSTHGQIGDHLRVSPRHISQVIADLGDAERESVAWWRIVADGGAIGRHTWRDVQMARLRDDGVVVSPVGIVQDLSVRLMKDLSAPPPGQVTREENIAPVKPRVRGMKATPQSSL
jgi:alkylated DNA nucleotide flippase Atl1